MRLNPSENNTEVFMRLLFLMTFLMAISLKADEGMYPMSEIHRLNLQEKGLQIDTDQIFSENAISLSDAIVNIGGCTGSFISKDGLILTNHHCAFGAAQAVSDADNDYLANGFIAKDRGEEIPAPGYTVRITQSFKDVSGEVLSVHPKYDFC
jgi:S1-C subfamily serine protease